MKKLLLLALLLTGVFAAMLEVPAVTQDNRGVKVLLECEVVDGKGRVLVATEPLVGISTQESERRAVEAVENFLGIDLSNKDVIFIFHTNTTKSIDGGSAGVAMAICLIGELLNKTPNPWVGVTGGIDASGKVLRVGGILQKAQAMREKTVFLIPRGQSITYTYTKTFYSPSPGVYIEEIYPVRVNVSEYAREKWNLRVVEIETLPEAVKWFFNESVAPKTTLWRIGELPEFEKLPRVGELAEYEIGRAKKVVGNNTVAQELLTKALNVPEGYSYTRANYAFLAIVSASTYRGDVTSAAKELEKSFKTTPTSDPYWRAEAELRLSWALFSTESEAARKEWLTIAAKMFAMERFGNESIDMEFVKKRADSMILEAKKRVEEARMAGVETDNAEKSLDFAMKSYEEGLYFAALYNAIDAIAWSEAYLGSTFNITGELKHEFPEAYRRHALYLLSTAQSHDEMVAAAFSAIRAELREKAFQNYPKLPFEIHLPSISWKDILILLLAGYVVVREMKRERGVELKEKEMMVFAEVKGEALKALRRKFEKKEITQEEYYRILRKLEGL